MTSLPETMLAVGIARPGGPDVLQAERRPVPRPGLGEILIKVAGAGVNRPDLMQRAGEYPPPPGASDIPGLEIAGEVAAAGPGADRHGIGDRICALVPGGGYAEYCVVHQDNALPVPAGLSAIEAAALPETFFTVWTNVFERGALKAGESFLVHGGGSGIGTTAIMLAKAFGAFVIATAGSPEKCRACLELGADVAIDYRAKDFVAEVKAVTSGRGVDLILDMVGGDYVARNFEAAAVEGRIVQIAFQHGGRTMLDFRRLMLKRLTWTGSTLRARSVAEKAAIARALERDVWPLIGAGRLKPVIFAVLPLAEAGKAHALLESGAPVGKIVLAVETG